MARAEVNYDEAKVPAYTLPDLLTDSEGRRIESTGDWLARRRPEIVKLFETYVYGKAPSGTPPLDVEVREAATPVFGGRGIRRQLRITIAGSRSQARDGVGFDLLMYLPAVDTPVPVLVGLNFGGNHAVQPDPEIIIPRSWMRDGPGVVDNRATEAGRGSKASRWPVPRIIERGYGVATAYYGDFDPDYHDGFRNGVHAIWPHDPGRRPPDAGGSIAAWAWGLSRVMDYLETDPRVDPKRVAVLGHSRLGKTALWAGALDTRFSIVISNESGCGGAALSRRRFGETVEMINTRFPHWFCENFKAFNDREDALPVDQHMLLALAAPRPLYVASATEDLWADPRGEFLAAKEAGAVYRLFGLEGLGVEEMPPPDTPVHGAVGYHIRTGKHDLTAYDWEQYMNFADRHWGRAERDRPRSAG